MDPDPQNLDACRFVKKSAAELPAIVQSTRLALLSGGSPLAPLRLRERFQHEERITVVEVCLFFFFFFFFFCYFSICRIRLLFFYNFLRWFLLVLGRCVVV